VKYPICTASIGEPPSQSLFQADSKIHVSDECAIDDIFNDFDSEEYDYNAESFEEDDV